MLKKSDLELIGFKTSGDWTVEDQSAFLENLATIYRIFLSKKLAKNFENDLPTSVKGVLPTLTAFEIFNNFEDYVDNSSRLRIHSMKMSSPGGFSFTGSGEVIKEMREFLIEMCTLPWTIKTIKLNNHTKNLNNKILTQKICSSHIQNIKKTISVLEYSGHSPEEIKMFLKPALESVQNLMQMQHDEKLDDLASNINYLPK